MAEEQPPVLPETQQEESPQVSESEVQESHTTPEETSVVEEKTKEHTAQDNGLDEEHQQEEQTVEAEGDTKVKEEGGDTVKSSGDITEDSVTSDAEKVGTGAHEESSSTQEEHADDSSSHESKSEASSQEISTAAEEEGRSKEEQTPSSAKDSADKVDNSEPAASSAKAGVAATTSKESAQEKEQRDKKSEIPRARTMPKSYGRDTKKDIAEKFGGVATSGVRVQRSTSSGANAVKNMLLQWCQAKTRGREGVDIQNFSTSWSSGLAFCALIVAFFPDAFDYDSLDPKNRRENFQLAFNAAEKYADCPPLLDVEDMVRMKVPDSKCVYTYVQELYRSLVAKGLVKTKKA